MQLTDEQLAARKDTLGSTDLVAIAGLAPWEGAGPMAVFLEKRGIVPPHAGDEATLEWGHTIEPVIAHWYENSQGVNLLPCGTLRHRMHDVISCTADYKIVDHSRALEIKNVSSFMSYAWDTHDATGIPDHVRAQVCIQAEIGGYADCHVAASIGGQAPRVWSIPADAETAGRLIDMGLKFWRDHVVTGKPPDGERDSDAFRTWLSSRWPQAPQRFVIDADAKAQRIAAERVEMAASIVQAESRKRACDAALMEILGANNADGIQGPGWSFTWRRTKSSGVRRQPRFTVKGSKGDE